MKWLLRGFPGHPLHPPLTDATIGAYTFATAMAVLSRLGVSEDNTATAWWLALIAGLVVTAPAALTGFAEWLDIPGERRFGAPRPLHLTAMLSATVIFAIAAGSGHADYVDGVVGGGSLVLTLAGYVVLAAGGWLGGAIVFVHGMRVLSLVDEPAARAISPVPSQEKEEAEA